jgi:hypothetical protein
MPADTERQVDRQQVHQDYGRQDREGVCGLDDVIFAWLLSWIVDRKTFSLNGNTISTSTRKKTITIYQIG